MRRFNIIMFGILFVAVVSVSATRSVRAVDFDFNVFVTTDSLIPEGLGQKFSNLPLPAFAGGSAVFEGVGSASVGIPGEEGVYFYRGGELGVLANKHTAIPGDSLGENFSEFGTPTLDANFNVAFQADGPSGQKGIYTVTDGVVSVVADTTTDIPDSVGPIQFTFFGDPWIQNGEVVFAGSGTGGYTGIYTNAGGTLRTVADNQTTNIPDGSGVFTSFRFVPSIYNGEVAFFGNGSSDQEGVYAEIGGSLVRIADKTTLIPDGGGATFPGFDATGLAGAMIYNGEVAFIAGDDAVAFPNQLGIYKYAGGSLTTIVDQSTVVPESGGTLTLFGPQGLSFYDGEVSFLAQDTIGPQSIVAILDGQVVRVLANGDPIAGDFAGSMGSYGQGVDDGSIGFNVGSIGANVIAIQQHSWVGVGSDLYAGNGTGTKDSYGNNLPIL